MLPVLLAIRPAPFQELHVSPCLDGGGLYSKSAPWASATRFTRDSETLACELTLALWTPATVPPYFPAASKQNTHCLPSSPIGSTSGCTNFSRRAHLLHLQRLGRAYCQNQQVNHFVLTSAAVLGAERDHSYIRCARSLIELASLSGCVDASPLALRRYIPPPWPTATLISCHAWGFQPRIGTWHIHTRLLRNPEVSQPPVPVLTLWSEGQSLCPITGLPAPGESPLMQVG